LLEVLNPHFALGDTLRQMGVEHEAEDMDEAAAFQQAQLFPFLQAAGSTQFVILVEARFLN
jgi:hypothetical protein